MSMPIISIIVPIYNAHATLDKCISSIQNQNYQNWELLLIDDGSTDDSSFICKQYQSSDSRIRYFYKKNGGVSSARNIGLENALGEWVCFVDSDDYIGDNYLNDVVNSSADICVKQCVFFNDQGKSAYQDPIIKACKYRSKFKTRLFFSKYIERSKISAPWCKFFKKNILRNIRFNENMRIGEDATFVFETICNCTSVQVLNKGLYFYRENFEIEQRKYNMSVKECVKSLESFLSAYSKSPILSIGFIRSSICYFKNLCVIDFVINRALWESSPLIGKYTRSYIYSRTFYYIEKLLMKTVLRYI